LVPYANFEYRARPFFMDSSNDIVLNPLLLQAPLFHPAAGCLAWASYANVAAFLSSCATAAFIARSLPKSSLAQRRDETTGWPSDGGGTILPQPTIAFGPRLQTSAAPYGQKKVPRSVLGDSDRLLVCRSLGDFLGFRHGLWLFWS
jgi:hypothetical protein